MFRNTTALAPKVVWTTTEDEALDIMTTILLIHKKWIKVTNTIFCVSSFYLKLTTNKQQQMFVIVNKKAIFVYNNKHFCYG